MNYSIFVALVLLFFTPIASQAEVSTLTKIGNDLLNAVKESAIKQLKKSDEASKEAAQASPTEKEQKQETAAKEKEKAEQLTQQVHAAQQGMDSVKKDSVGNATSEVSSKPPADAMGPATTQAEMPDGKGAQGESAAKAPVHPEVVSRDEQAKASIPSEPAKNALTEEIQKRASDAYNQATEAFKGATATDEEIQKIANANGFDQPKTAAEQARDRANFLGGNSDTAEIAGLMNSELAKNGVDPISAARVLDGYNAEGVSTMTYQDMIDTYGANGVARINAKRVTQGLPIYKP